MANRNKEVAKFLFRTGGESDDRPLGLGVERCRALELRCHRAHPNAEYFRHGVLADRDISFDLLHLD